MSTASATSSAGSTGTTGGTPDVHEHIDPLGAYIAVFVSLMILLLTTVGAYYLKFDEWFGPQWGFINTMIALIIATIKTSLVMLVFMHLRHATKLTWVISSCGFIWLCIMITFTFADYLSRRSLPEADPVAMMHSAIHDREKVAEQPTKAELPTTQF